MRLLSLRSLRTLRSRPLSNVFRQNGVLASRVSPRAFAVRCHPERREGSLFSVAGAVARPFSVKGRSSAFLAAVFASRCHPEPIRAKRGWVRDLLFPSPLRVPDPSVLRVGLPPFLPFPLLLSSSSAAKDLSSSAAEPQRRKGFGSAASAVRVSQRRQCSDRVVSAVRSHPERAQLGGIALRSVLAQRSRPQPASVIVSAAKNLSSCANSNSITETAAPLRGSELKSPCGNVGFSSGHGFIRAENARKSMRLQPLRDDLSSRRTGSSAPA